MAVGDLLTIIAGVPFGIGGQTNFFKVHTVGDVELNAELLRTLTGASGEGVRVGVISGGLEGLAKAKATGDLPLDVTYNPDIGQTGGEGNKPGLCGRL